jgi:putative ABC transport system substrate-binding protein
MAFRRLSDGGAQMVLVLSSQWFAEHRRRLADLALANRLPSMFRFTSYVVEGGLMAYGVDQVAIYRRTGNFVAKILKGAKPADLPIEQATKFELVINLKTAKALGIDIPPLFLARADEVIE